MRKFCHYLVIAVFAISFGSINSPVFGQRIGIEDEPSSDKEQSSEKKDTTQDDGRPQRVIPPGQISDQSREQQMSESARVQNLKADSAAMQVKYREQINELKSDSTSMRKKIKQLKKRINTLESKIAKLKKNSQSSSRQMAKKSNKKDKSSTSKNMNQRKKMKQTDETDKSSDKSSDKGSDKSSEKMQNDESPGKSAESASSTKYNPNTASISDLKSIKGLSERLAKRIEWYRREVRPFNKRDNLRRVPGIDRQIFEKISPYFHEGPYQ